MSQSSHVPNDGMSQSQIIGSNVSTVERMSQSQCSVMSGSFSGHLGLGMTQSQVEAWQEVMGSTRADDNVLDLSNQVKMKLQLYYKLQIEELLKFEKNGTLTKRSP